MNIHLNKNEVLKIICDKFNIPYDVIKDPNNKIVSVELKNPDDLITWEC